MKKNIIFSLILSGASNMIMAQDKEEDKKPLNFSGYAEVYYQHNFNNPQSNSKPSFIYSHNRNNEVNINLALANANYSTENLRANFTLATGTYMNANYAAEPGLLKNLYEANIGLKISRTNDLWLDVGIMPSHIGFESAIGKDNWTLTRSLSAENSPYFETGARISYTTSNKKWFLSALILNGWQRIQRIDGNSTPAFGHQLTYRPNNKLTLNSSSFIGSDKVDTARTMRYFHNLYMVYQISTKLGITAGFDIGLEQKAKGSRHLNTWYSPTFIVRYLANAKLNLAARAEYYKDKNAVIINTNTADGFKTLGYSANLDYQILKNVQWRNELRYLKSKNPIFENKKNSLIKDNLTATTAINITL